MTPRTASPGQASIADQQRGPARVGLGRPARLAVAATAEFLLLLVAINKLGGAFGAAVIGALVGAAGIFSLADPLGAVLLTLCFLPFTRLTTGSLLGVPGLNASTLLLLELMLARFVYPIRPPLPASARRLRRALWLTIPTMVSAFLVAMWFGDRPTLELAEMLKRMVSAPLFAILALPFLAYEGADFEAALVLMMGGLVVSLQGYYEFLEHGNRGTIDKSRILGVFGQPNQTGAYLAYVLPVMLLLFIALVRRRRMIALLSPAWFVAYRVLAATFSRGALLAAAAGLVEAIWRRSWILTGIVAAGALGLTFLTPDLLPESVLYRFESTFTPAGAPATQMDMVAGARVESSAGLRLLFWRAGFNIALQDPVLGIGEGRFPFELTRELAPLRASGVLGREADLAMNRDAHSMYVLVACERGLLGLGAFAYLLIAMFMAGRAAQRSRSRFTAVLGAALQGTVLAVAVANATGSNFQDPELAAPILIFAVAVAAHAPLPRAFLARRGARPAIARGNNH